MVSVDRDALLCDVAETYNIYDFRAVPVATLATLCVGLRDDSRIKMRMNGMNYISHGLLLASIADALNLIRYGLAGKTEKPSLYTDIMVAKKYRQDEYARFSDGEAFERAKQKIIKRSING